MAAPCHRGSPVAVLAVAATLLVSLCLRPGAAQQGEDKGGEEEAQRQQRYNFRFVRHARDAPLVSHFNYIVVGGGTAGCPLAATLSEHSRVLLLERGGYPYGNRNVSSEYHFADALADTSPRSPAQRFVSEDGVVNARARVLGGGSCLNAGFYTRASGEYVRAAGWDARLVNASYRWVEKELVFRPDVPKWQCALREGLLQAGVTPDNGYTFDHVPGTKIGGTIFDSTGRRHTAADFLRTANPRRLTVFLHATVSQILFRHREGSAKPVAYGVVFTDPMGVQHRVYLRGGGKSEVILAAGTLGSPQLLMLSGVGPRGQLEKHGIRTVMDHPMVGQGVADNPMNSVFVPSPVPVTLSLVQIVGVTRFGSFIEGVSGSQFGIPLHARGVRRRSHSFGMFSPMTGQLGTLPPSERTPEAMRRAADAMRALDRRAFRGGFILEKILGPLSTGHIELRSTDPRANPAVTFNYFKDPKDVERCVRGIETIERVVRSRAFSRFTYANATAMDAAFDRAKLANFLNLLPRHPRDTRPLQQYCRDTVMTIWHYHGGCHVGPVVDQDYRVIGVEGLRVVDSSTFKYSPGTNPQATVMMLGRYMGLKIQTEALTGK
ncbi:protein HOTHEAD-like [Lolium rigidum]|uniref:protein HOTHEAD-like n=1 Tax=Lolium rigidum TaxID=89674 RepID=UPI001F5D8EB2|nr:protein HOTHEAD-like [Lolium rigidum]